MTDVPHCSDERWSPIGGLDATHQVSTCGRVWRNGYLRTTGRASWWQAGHLIGGFDHEGYDRFDLRDKPRRRSVTAHVLVAEAFLGARPESMDVCHNDGDARNNHLHNLRYDTRSANCEDMVEHGRHHRARINICLNGHLLEAPNLFDTTYAAHGVRVCRACNVAAGRINYCKGQGFTPATSHKDLSDLFYWFGNVVFPRAKGGVTAADVTDRVAAEMQKLDRPEVPVEPWFTRPDRAAAAQRRRLADS